MVLLRRPIRRRTSRPRLCQRSVWEAVFILQSDPLAPSLTETGRQFPREGCPRGLEAREEPRLHQARDVTVTKRCCKYRGATLRS